MDYQVKLKSFEGPLDLLLNLIEEQKLDITQVFLAKVADDFLNYLKNQNQISLKNLAEFLDVASKLTLIKSKSLLPQLELTEEEQEDIEDLENRLKEYQAFKQITEELKDLSESDERGFSRKTKVSPEISVFDPPNVNHEMLFNMFKDVLDKMPKEEKFSKAVVRNKISMEDKISEIRKILSLSKSIKFGEFLRKAKTKVEIIISFLAILELLKLKVLEVEQNENFSEIILQPKEV